MVVTSDVTPITCNAACDGVIQLTAQGGTGAYTYVWDPVPPNGQGNDVATGLCADTWTCAVSDANGCVTTVTVELVDPPVLEAALTTTDNACFAECEGTATLVITGGVEPYDRLGRRTGATLRTGHQH
ncbi:MAG: SprB repeat-containing protein [Flavobacteriales bacterium]|nr:SprB repeat-containing protein [Flavobacteriales bacterium]